MKKIVSVLIASVTWFAVTAQYFLMIQNSTLSTAEATTRFFSYFTILTNLLVAIYFTWQAFQSNEKYLHGEPGLLTAITLYITIVGLVYQILLRHIWDPQGLQRLVDELLHSVIPVLVIAFWSAFENKKEVRYRSIPKWLLYPGIYFAFILLRGSSSGFYPYPFIDVGNLGINQVMINAVALLGIFLLFAVLLVAGGKIIPNKKS